MSRHVALVTGASSGIGAAVARRLASAGAGVLVSGRDRARCQRVVDEIRGGGGEASAIVLDVASPQSIHQAIEEATRAAAIDWLVYNAGIAISAPFTASAASAR